MKVKRDLKKEARTALRRDGLMLLTDPVFPSLVSLVVGAPVKGSWWGHAQGNAIYNLSNDLDDDDDVTMLKLVSGKITFVHAALWPALLAACGKLQAWQKSVLTEEDDALLKSLRKARTLRTDELPALLAKRVKVLEPLLLFKSGQIHTESGAHATVIQTWDLWASEVGIDDAERLTADAGRAALEAAVSKLNERSGARAKLPWQGRK